jgi:hypothetical protein
VDWDAAFRNWLRKAAEINPQPPYGGHGPDRKRKKASYDDIDMHAPW